MMVRTNIVLDDCLVQKCMKTTGIKTKKELLDYALHELLRHELQMDILQLKGKVQWQGNLNKLRTDRFKK
jgi:Arc/MetJ family transcription regulator